MATISRGAQGVQRSARGPGRLIAKIVLLAVAAALLFAGYVNFVLRWSYSDGERAGWVQSLSHQGWVCKTWEGEMAIVSLPGTAPEKFHFTVWDDKVAAQINRLNGHRVSLHYEEKIGIPSSCFGDTRYYVTQVRPVDEIPLSAGVVVPVPDSPQATAGNPGSGTPGAPAPGSSAGGAASGPGGPVAGREEQRDRREPPGAQ